MRTSLIILLCIITTAARAQQGFVFTRFTIDDNVGLTSNVIYSLHQDEKGYIWVGTANGLQRFDGRKFIHFSHHDGDPENLPFSAISQIVPFENGKLVLNSSSMREIGIFNPADFSFKRIAIRQKKDSGSTSDYFVWKDAKGNLYLNYRHGVMRYDKNQNAFLDNRPFDFPEEYVPRVDGVFEDTIKQQIWFVGKKGICIYDRRSNQMWDRNKNPQQLPILKNEEIQDWATQVFIDSKRRIWIFGWPKLAIHGQFKYCLDSTGSTYLLKDTAGLHTGPDRYNEYNNFFESKRAGLWIYGLGILFNWNKNQQRFNYTGSNPAISQGGIQYNMISQLIEDRDGNLWMATDKGLYYFSFASGSYAIINLALPPPDDATAITDILEISPDEFWFSTWGRGVLSIDKDFKHKYVNIFSKKGPPASWPMPIKRAIDMMWQLYREKRTGHLWIGCNGGVILEYDPVKDLTNSYYQPEILTSTVRAITEDQEGTLWFGTQNGKVLKMLNGKLIEVLAVKGLIFKIFCDNEGLLWITSQDAGLYCLNPETGKVVRHYTNAPGPGKLYSTSGRDIEQLNDSILVYGAGALNFINKKTAVVRQLRYEDGLPSNSVQMLRKDREGVLWIITSNGLCRYNPVNDRVTAYGRKDGVTTGGLTKDADFHSSKDYIMFAGANAVLLFKPSYFANAAPPPDVAITDFKLFNEYLPVDSLQRRSSVRLNHNENSISIYFSALSYQQQDHLTYFFKLEGIDKDWISAKELDYQNYSFLPPGDYVFKVYAENVEGQRSGHTTELKIRIDPPFWRSKWFISLALLVLITIIYFIHQERVKRLLAVEKVRNRVARDLHDDMGSTLSTINILSAMAKSKMSTDTVKTAGYLSKISDNSQRMMEAMDDIVWSIKPSNDSMQRVIARMREFATSVLEAKDILLSFNVDETVLHVKLNMEARRDLFLIFKEALNNAAKYSKAPEMKINLVVKHKELLMSIKDNGIGFDVATADGGDGLGNLQKRANGLKARLTIISAPGEGTEINLSMPVQ